MVLLGNEFDEPVIELDELVIEFERGFQVATFRPGPRYIFIIGS
jgi:hypothetical protein